MLNLHLQQWWQNLMVNDSASVVVEPLSQFIKIGANKVKPVDKPAPRLHIDLSQILFHISLLTNGEEQAQAKGTLPPLWMLSEG